jgi:hypothetical protein
MTPQHGLEVNTNNLREYEPYYDDGKTLQVDKIWWETVPEVAKQRILERISINLTSVPVPHEHSVSKTERERIAYTEHIDAFDYNHWCSARSDPYILYKIPERIKKLLVACNMSGNKPHPDIEEDWLPELPYTPCFARLGATSGKNDFPVRPLYTKQDLLTYLSQGNNTLVKRELSVDKDTYLVLMPWKEIPRRYEFRVFFRNNKVVSASQQFTTTLFNYTQEELQDLSECFQTLSFPVHYYEWTADTYWDPDTKTMRLIECNPFGAYTGCGASLFNWHNDRDIFSGKESPEFRYLSVINF